MIGWKRIVIAVGERIGKTHLTYAQGACAEITAAATIAAADGFGLPVSTTHVLASGIAGTMAANGSGRQRSTVRNIAGAGVLTLPVARAISAARYLLFSRQFCGGSDAIEARAVEELLSEDCRATRRQPIIGSGEQSGAASRTRHTGGWALWRGNRAALPGRKAVSRQPRGPG
jgi:hypothetical protein